MSDRAESVYERQSFGTPLGLGAQPALLLVDFVAGFVDPDVFGGGNIATAAERAVALLALAREAGWPIAHARIVFADDGADANIFARKVPGMLRLTETAAIGQFVPALRPAPGELVVRKRLPSAFRGTDLAGWLASHRVDSLVIGGCTLSPTEIAAGNFIRKSVFGAQGDPDELLLARRCPGDAAVAW